MSTANSANSISTLLTQYEDTLADTAEINSDWIDCATVDKFQFTGDASVSGMTATIDSKATSTGAVTTTSVTYTDSTLYQISMATRQRFMRFKWVNNTGSQVIDASLEIKLTYGSSDKATVAPLGHTISDTTQAVTTQSVLKGEGDDGNYNAVNVEDGRLQVNQLNGAFDTNLILKEILQELQINNAYLSELTDKKIIYKDLKNL